MKAEIRQVIGNPIPEDWAEVQRWIKIFSSPDGETADTEGLEPSAERLGGSSPSPDTSSRDQL